MQDHNVHISKKIVMPAQAGIQFWMCRVATLYYWIPAFAGMTVDEYAEFIEGQGEL
ncbi:MAG: hypothetical protein QM808_14800 [Steroidobacteraceae bacterium]